MYPFYNSYFPFLIPFIPPNCNKPPTLYAVLNSIVNGEKDEEDYTKIKNLAKEGRNTIFNFDYPLSTNIDKENFECMILNKFLMRRIGFETVTAFQIALNVKLNEIMPLYNKMFDAIENWDLFSDGQTIEKEGYDNRISTTDSSAKNTLENSSETSTENISDRRNSELPQNQLQDLRDGNYVTDYNYDTDNSTSNDVSSSVGNSEANTKTNDNNEYKESIKYSVTDKITLLKELQENINNVYTLIFKDLECLFYQLL